MARKAATIILKLAVSGAILYLLFIRMEPDTFFAIIAGISPAVMVAAIAIFFATQCVSTYRWSVVLGIGYKAPLKKLFSFYLIGMFFNNFLPTIVGGDLIKGYYLYKLIGKWETSYASILIDRYTGLMALITITAVALAIGFGGIMNLGGAPLLLAFLVFIGGFMAASAFVWSERLHGYLVDKLLKVKLFKLNEKIETFYGAFMGYKGRMGVIVKAYALSFIVQGGVIAGYIMLGKEIGIDVHPGYYFLFVPLSTAVSMIPVSLAGLGVREGAFVFLFTRAGSTVEEALSLSLLWFAVMVSVSVLGGVEYVRAGNMSVRSIKERP